MPTTEQIKDQFDAYRSEGRSPAEARQGCRTWTKPTAFTPKLTKVLAWGAGGGGGAGASLATSVVAKGGGAGRARTRDGA